MNETVCAVVVTYNRKELLIKCLESLCKQTRPVQGIYIVDNASTDGTPALLMEKGYIRKMPPDKLSMPWETEFLAQSLSEDVEPISITIHYVRMNENSGGAGGFHEGIKRGYKKGYDWLWVMDDDVKADKKCLENLLKYKSKFNVIVPLRLSKQKDINEWPAVKYNLSNPLIKKIRDVSLYSRYKDPDELPKIIEVQDFTFEGPLICISIVEKIGYPKKDLFIYADDTDYALRIRYKLREKIVLVREAKIFRALEQKENPEINWKTYYILRNMNYIYLKYGQNILVKLKPFILTLGIVLKSTLKGNLKKIKVSLAALFDCYSNNFKVRYKPKDKL